LFVGEILLLLMQLVSVVRLLGTHIQTATHERIRKNVMDDIAIDPLYEGVRRQTIQHLLAFGLACREGNYGTNCENEEGDGFSFVQHLATPFVAFTTHYGLDASSMFAQALFHAIGAGSFNSISIGFLHGYLRRPEKTAARASRERLKGSAPSMDAASKPVTLPRGTERLAYRPLLAARGI
jgi:hypothetical protein